MEDVSTQRETHKKIKHFEGFAALPKKTKKTTCDPHSKKKKKRKKVSLWKPLGVKRGLRVQSKLASLVRFSRAELG